LKDNDAPRIFTSFVRMKRLSQVLLMLIISVYGRDKSDDHLRTIYWGCIDRSFRKVYVLNIRPAN